MRLGYKCFYILIQQLKLRPLIKKDDDYAPGIGKNSERGLYLVIERKENYASENNCNT